MSTATESPSANMDKSRAGNGFLRMFAVLLSFLLWYNLHKNGGAFMEPQITVSLAVILSAITLLSTTLSSVLTVLIKNHHDRKMVEANFYTHHRAEVIENYLSAASTVVRVSSVENRCEFGKRSLEIYFYIPQQLWSKVDEINHILLDSHNQTDKDYVFGLLSDLCKELEPPRGKVQKRGKRDIRHKD